MTSRTVHRHEIPVDDQWHQVDLNGPILHVATRDPSKVEMWVLDNGDDLVYHQHWYRVFGTGQPLTDHTGKHVGSVVTADGALVWHLFEGHRP